MPNQKKSIRVKDFSDIQEEFIANAALSPGHLVEIMYTGLIRKHVTAKGNALKMFALEDELQGKGVDDAYAAGDPVQVMIARTGDRVNAILADGETAVIGNWLVSNGDGTLRVYVAEKESYDTEPSSGGTVAVDMPNPDELVGIAAEALDLSASSGDESSGLQGDRRLEIIVA
jgi:hypothetical protein